MPINCPQCGTANADGERFCGGCGQRFSAPPAQPNPADQVAAPPVPEFQTALVAAPPPPPEPKPPPLPRAGELEPTNDGNTSGQGAAAILPAEAKGWCEAGFIWCGAFGFAARSPLMGFIGLGLWLASGLIPQNKLIIAPWLYVIYIVYIGLKGRELMWRNRRFHSVNEYVLVMKVWDGWGWIFIVLNVALMILARIMKILN